MTATATFRPTRGRGSAAVTSASGVAAIVTLSAAVTVIAVGVVASPGSYGSRLAWLIGVALPLLALTMVLALVSVPTRALALRGTSSARSSRREKIARGLFVTALSLIGIPLALATGLVAVSALVFAVHGVSLLL
jgi:hypothetical protein